MKTWQDIPGWFDFPDLYDEAVHAAADGAVFVELGAWLGKSTAYLAQRIMDSGKQIRLHVVDHWKGEEGDPHYAHVRDPFRQFMRNMYDCGLRHLLTIHCARTTFAARKFKDASADFVFVDAGHAYEWVRADLLAWIPKLKPTGHIAGHDYGHPGVRAAVHEIIGESNVRERNASWERIRPPS